MNYSKSMARPDGLAKTGGRQKGTPNKRTLVLKEAFDFYGIDMIAQLAEILPQLEVEKRADVLLDLMVFLYPKRKTVDAFMEMGDAKAIVTVPDDSDTPTAPHGIT